MLSGITLLLPCQQTLAGPPLATEDPAILEQGQWEIITATTATSTDGGEVYQAPVVDVSLGLIDGKLQVGASYPYVFSDPDDEGSDSDFGNLLLGLKWRFIHSEDLQVAFAPLYAFGINRSTAEQGIGEDEDVLGLPLAVEYRINPVLNLNTSLGYASVDGGEDRWGYGAALAYQLNSRWQLLGELSGGTDTDFDDNILDIRTGFDFTIAEDFHLLFSIATGLHASGDEDDLDYDIYLALQWLR